MCSLKVRKYHRKIPVLESVFNKVPGLKACNFITKKVQHRCFSAKFLRTPFLTKHLPQWLVLCHCKLHLYRPRIFLTIPLYSNFIPCLFQLNFVFLLPAYIFLQSYSNLFVFYAKQKDSEFVYDHQTNFRCFLYTYIYIYSYLHFLIYI